MRKPPAINEQARSTLESLSRFWLFKRKNLVAEVQSYFDDAQQQLDTLSEANQQSTDLCANQSSEISKLELYNDSLIEELQAIKSSLSSVTDALDQAELYTRGLEVQQTQAMAKISGLEANLTNTQQQVEELNNSKLALAKQCTEQAEKALILEAHNSEISDLLQETQARMAELGVRRDQAIAEIAILQQQVEGYKQELAEKYQHITALEQNLSKTQQHIEILDDAKQQLTEQCSGQTIKINSLASKNASLTIQLKEEQANASEQKKGKEQALAKIFELNTYLEENKSQLLSTEQDVKILEILTEELKASQEHLQSSYQDINKQHLSLAEKFSLVKRVLSQQPPANEALAEFADLINCDYMDFASRESSLAGEAQAMLDMQAILAEIKLLNNFPSISGKTILSIAGGFSSGKSAFVNSFIRNSDVKLATGINPVTVVPSYVVCSEETSIKGYAYNGGAINLESKLYASMCHEYIKSFGFDLRRILPFISVEVPMDPALFENLCIIDTPGYNPGTTGGSEASDRITAASLVNQASALIWVIGLDPAGTIAQSDIDFIESTPFREESLYIVLNKADVKSDDDILEIMDQVADDLSFAGISYAGMCAYTSIRKKTYPSTGMSLDRFLRSINRKTDVINEIHNKIDRIFASYSKAIHSDISKTKKLKQKFETIKLEALKTGGTELYKITRKLLCEPEELLNNSELESLHAEAEALCLKLKNSATDAINIINQKQRHQHPKTTIHPKILKAIFNNHRTPAPT